MEPPPSSEPAPTGPSRASRSAPAEIAFHGVSKRYSGRNRPAVDDLSFEVAPGEICVLIGPSGCGKTTALKLINRLIPLTSGEIMIDGQSIADLDVTQLRRGIGYVFQQIGLFSHMTIESNIGTVPRLLGWDKQRIRERARELLELVGLDPQGDLHRYPGEFSGGQQQRIGVARAMAVDPPIMLMDEPFGAIDPIARDRLQNDFLELHRQVRKTIIFVTHDIDEAIRMGDRIAIMSEGRLVQIGASDELLATPANEFVASFVGVDRGLKRLRVRTVRDVALDLARGPARAGLPTLTLETSLHDALSLMLASGTTELRVAGGNGPPARAIRLQTITRLLAPEAAPQAATEAVPEAAPDTKA